ncbi:MAG: transcriptional regulator with XRE-family HTH domain [Gammaproteobacteria bacterium]|jgi:transcriptional regulator with XRE-family HTH domain
MTNYIDILYEYIVNRHILRYKSNISINSPYITTMNIEKQLTDEAILAEIGQRISGRRVDLNMTQAEVAKKAGVSKRSLERIEDGASSQMLSIIKIFRVLDLMDNLDRMVPEVRTKPMNLLKQKRKIRIRASKKKPIDSTATVWKWKEDE